MEKPSKIFVRYRALGFVANHIPLTLRYVKRRNEYLAVTSIGKAFHTYGCSKLNLLNVSGQHPEDITCLTSDEYHVYTACKNIIYAWRRGNECDHVYKGPSADVAYLLPFGPHLLAIYEDNLLVAWDIKEETIELEIPLSDVTVTSILHPSGYLNKILIGSHEGALQLWNIKETKLVYTFVGWGSPVTTLEQAPAFDTVGIGLECGDIYVHNLKYDKTVVKFTQDWGAVTGLSFRTTGIPMMASSSTMGHIALWDLKKKRLHSEIRDAHKEPISGLQFLSNEPILVTNSSDNSIKIWIFDLPDEGGRLLKLRDGHSCPPTKIRFYGSDGKNIISAGLDSTMRSFSTEADNLNKSLGQASFNRAAAKRNGVAKDPKKIGPIIDFVSDSIREKDWDNIAAVHRYSRTVTTWSYDRSTMGQHKLANERFKGVKSVEALCLSISNCGNFVVIGYNSGHLDKFNIQSGIHRGSFGTDKAHDGCIRGVSVHNGIVVSGGSDKQLKFWNLNKCTLIEQVKLEHGIAKMIQHSENAMLAVALDDFSVIIVDEGRNIIRRFSNNEGSLSDMAFSFDARWLTTASMDSSIKTWDLITGKLIDWFVVSPICVSLAFSSTGEFLATAHTGSLGIFLWANATLYSTVSLHPLPDTFTPRMFELPVITLEGKEDEEDAIEESEDENVPVYKSPEQLSDDLVTLSRLPQSHWLNLLDLDIIKKRNKPKEPFQVPKNAPFFLPTVSGLKPTFFIEDDKDKKDSEKSRVLNVLQHGSEFFKLLESSNNTQNYEAVLTGLMSFSPSQIDVEVRCLSPENGGSLKFMEYFLKAVCEVLKTKKYFELTNSYLNLFLQVHYEEVSQSNELTSILKEVHQMRTWEGLQEKINFCLCFGNFARSAVL